MTAPSDAPPQAALDGVVQAFRAGAWPDLEARAIAITQVWPQVAIGWKALGLALVRGGKASDALAPLKRALELSPNDAEPHLYLGDALRGLGQLDAAGSSYDSAVRLRPSAETHNRIGSLFFEKGMFGEAEAHFFRASALQPQAPQFHMNRGTALRHLSKLDDAEASFRRAVSLGPRDAQAHYNLGNLLRDADRLAEAEEPYRRAIAIDPDHVQAMTNLAQTLADLGHAEEALELCRAVIERRPDHALAHWNKSLIDLRLGNFAEGWYEWRWRPPAAHDARFTSTLTITSAHGDHAEVCRVHRCITAFLDGLRSTVEQLTPLHAYTASSAKR